MSDRGQAGHEQRHGMAKQTLRLAFFLTMLILAAELVGGFVANSLALLSDAGHVLTDIFVLGLAWFATAQAERPANASKTFGYHRVGILAALVNAVTLIVIALAILWEAVGRFQHPEKVEPLVMFLSAGIGIGLNLFIGFGLQKEGDNLNVRAAALHVFGDVGASVAVIVAGVVILLTDWYPADPILSVGIAGLIAVGAWRILRETTDILLEAVPKDINLSELVLYWLLSTSVRERGPLGFHRHPLSLYQVCLSHRKSRGMVSCTREYRGGMGNRPSGKAYKGFRRGLIKTSSGMTDELDGPGPPA